MTINRNLYWWTFFSYFFCMYSFVHGSLIPLILVTWPMLFLTLIGGGHDGVGFVISLSTFIILLGQLLFLLDFLLKGPTTKHRYFIIGVLLQLFGSIVFIEYANQPDSIISYITLLPFFILAILTYKSIASSNDR